MTTFIATIATVYVLLGLATSARSTVQYGRVPREELCPALLIQLMVIFTGIQNLLFILNSDTRGLDL